MIFQEAPFGISSIQIILWTSFAIDFMISNTYFKLEVIISHHYYLKLNSLKASKWLETNASSGFIFSLCVTCCRKNTPIQSQKGSSINGMWQTVIMNFYNCPNKWNGTEIECDNIFFKTDRQALSPNIMQIFFVHFVEHGMQWWKKHGGCAHIDYALNCWSGLPTTFISVLHIFFPAFVVSIQLNSIVWLFSCKLCVDLHLM